jgi:hypothetical protein
VLDPTDLLNLRDEERVKGRAEGRQAALVQLLKLKFPRTIPDDLVARIEMQADIFTLSDWFRQAFLAPSLDDFRAAIRL